MVQPMVFDSCANTWAAGPDGRGFAQLLLGNEPKTRTISQTVEQEGTGCSLGREDALQAVEFPPLPDFLTALLLPSHPRPQPFTSAGLQHIRWPPALCCLHAIESCLALVCSATLC